VAHASRTRPDSNGLVEPAQILPAELIQKLQGGPSSSGSEQDHRDAAAVP